ncbi:MAG: guanine deaminase [Methylococcaceae bacterium]|nr:guanine deaminase [Methylococcaceae bacterium]
MNVLHLGRLAHLRNNPFQQPDALEIIDRGALLVGNDGRILAVGDRSDLAEQSRGARSVDHGSAWLLPGMVDGHSHFPQYHVTAAAGADLLDWLERSVFPAEARFADQEYAQSAAAGYVDRLLASGTTTAMVFGSQFLGANRALFDAAKAAGIRLIAGMTVMDRGAPESLLQTLDQARDGMERLIAHVRSDPLLHYAVSPRFAPACSPALLELCGDIHRAHPDSYVQTHINETPAEIERVARLFPERHDYLDVYQHFGLVGRRSLLAHDIHAGDHQLERMADAHCSVCHCPTSNLYLGSGLFPLQRHVQRNIPVAIGTDIGAGTRFSVWQELAEVYKVQQVQGYRLNAAQLLYLGTLGGAEALDLAHETGNFAVGKSADYLALDPLATPYLAERLDRCESREEQLFCLLHLATDKELRATFVAGQAAWVNCGMPH